MKRHPRQGRPPPRSVRSAGHSPPRFPVATPSSIPIPSISTRLSDVSTEECDFFLDVVEAGSLRAAAAMTGRDIKTVRKRLSRIEDILGAQVAVRDHGGLQLTLAGVQLLQVARDVRNARVGHTFASRELRTRPTIRIGVTEGLGTFWLMPRLVEFQRLHSDVQIDLICEMQRVDVLNGGFDIAVQLERPEDNRTPGRQIGTLHLMPFAADRYLKSAGIPNSVDDWPGHQLVWQEADQVASHLLPYFVGRSDPGNLIGISTNNSSAHFRAIATGGGIGILPTYARAISRKVRPIDIGVNLKREIFCLVNPARARSPEILLTIKWLEESFSGEKYPWFGERFVHPTDFEASVSADSVVSLFEGFIDVA